jgi:hypothetical protein
VLRQTDRTALAAGDAVGVDLALDHLHWFDRDGKRIEATH